jgi:parallel beta-helix repeat protein
MKRLTILTILFAGFAFVTASATIIHVPADYPTIQQGVDACATYDTVMVANGTYVENVIIMVPIISLIGENRNNTIIDGSGVGDVVYIGGFRVLIRNFTIRNSGIGFLDAGIEIGYADSCLIECCDLEDNYSGLCLFGSCQNTISRCRFSFNTNGVHFREDSLVATPDNFGNTIQNNIIENNSAAGIFFEHTFMSHHTSNLVSGNRIINNDQGLSTIMSEDNTFAYNDIVGSADYGVAHGMCFGGGENNRWHHNNFILNHSDTLQASDIGGGVDYWYCVADSEGNHWSDYTGPDNNGDGIGDIPYEIDGNESQDLAPLMNHLVSSIAGSVSDGAGPIADVHVEALGTSIDDYTDSGGTFALAGLGAGMYDVSFTHPSYRDTVVLSVPATLDFATWLYVVMDPLTEADENDPFAPERLTLLQNYPNPFNSQTRIGFFLSQSRDVDLTIYDLLGRKIQTLIDGYREAGVHIINFNASDLPSGVYFYRLKAGDFIGTRRMLLLK